MEYGEYFSPPNTPFSSRQLERTSFFYARLQEEPLTLLGVASTPVLGVLSAGCDVSFAGSLLRPVSSLQLSSQR